MQEYLKKKTTNIKAKHYYYIQNKSTMKRIDKASSFSKK